VLRVGGHHRGYVDAMPEQDPLADVITLVAAPIAGAVRSVEQFRTGVDEFLRGIENFNRTMESLNETAERMNVLLQEVEEPIKAAVPQVTRAINNADEMMQAVSGPAMAAAPGLARLAETMNTPQFRQLPDQLATFSDVLVDMSARMAPLTQFAETAGGLFGLRKPGAGQRPSGQSPAPEAGADSGASAETDVDDDAPTRAVQRARGRSRTATEKSADKGSTKSATRKKTSPAKTGTTKTGAKKAAAKKAAPNETTEQ
jgi:hypothetical protein